MAYEEQFMKDYRRFSNLGSSYYKTGYTNLLNALSKSSPTLNTLTGVGMAAGGSYKGSKAAATIQRRGIETRNADRAQSSVLDMYMQGQRLAQNSLAGAQAAYQYEDSKPSFWEELGGFAAGGLLQHVTGSLLGGKSSAQNPTNAYRPAQTMSGGSEYGMTGYVNVPDYDPFNYNRG